MTEKKVFEREKESSAFPLKFAPVFSRMSENKSGEYVDRVVKKLPRRKLKDEVVLHDVEKLAVFRERYLYPEDRSAKISYLSARCPQWMSEDFNFVCRVFVGEEPSVVLRLLVREFLQKHIPLDDV